MKHIACIHILSSVLFLILSFLLITNSALAETKTFVKEYTFHAGDEDSKNSCRVISLREVKRLLLEELGTYLESVTEVQGFKITKDQITTLTTGIVQTEIVDEKWDGHTYWLKSKITADSRDVIKSIDSLRKDHQKTKELAEVRKCSDGLLKENERLRKELATATGEKKHKDAAAYNKTIKDLNATEWFEKGYALDESGYHGEAVAAFSKAIKLSPQLAPAYYNRGRAYGMLGDYSQAIKDINKAIKIGQQDATAYNNRGVAYHNLSNYKQPIMDYNKAIELNPQYALAYYNRGVVYGNLGSYKQAIKDYNKAIEFNPQYADAYLNRGIAYIMIHNDNQGIADAKIAARLGSEGAQGFLKTQEIAW